MGVAPYVVRAVAHNANHRLVTQSGDVCLCWLLILVNSWIMVQYSKGSNKREPKMINDPLNTLTERDCAFGPLSVLSR